MNKASLQVQSVLYKCKKDALLRALEALARAVEIDRSDGQHLTEVIVHYGDASPQPIFSYNDINDINDRFKSTLEVRYTFFDENTGTAKGHNRLLNECTSSFMMIMNPDVIVTPRFFKEIFAPYGMGVGRVGLVEARQTPIEHPKEYDRESGETSWASTACVVFPTIVARAINGFDEDSFFMYCDDVDFSWRIRQMGYQVIYAPRAVVFHGKTLSTKGQWQPTAAERHYSMEAALVLAYKWSNEQLCRKLIEQFANSTDSTAQQVAAEFTRREAAGKLPIPQDSEHKIAQFINGNYTKHRFAL